MDLDEDLRVLDDAAHAPSDEERLRALRLALGEDDSPSARLALAVVQRSPIGIERALAAGADPNVRVPPSHERAVVVATRDACRASDTGALRALLAGRPRLGTAYGPSGTELHEAVRGRSQSVVDLLVAAGANPRHLDSAGRTPAMLARSMGLPAVGARLEQLTPGPAARDAAVGG